MAYRAIFDETGRISSEFLPPVAPFTAIYGSFGSSQTQLQTGNVANTPTPVTHNETFVSNGVSYDIANPSRLVVSATGVYKVAFSIQFDKSGGGNSIAEVWLRVNGNNVPNSASRCVVAGQTGETFPYVEFYVPLNAGQYVECVFTSPDATMAVTAFPASVAPVIPAVPSIISNIQRIS